jgi:acid phosphatase
MGLTRQLLSVGFALSAAAAVGGCKNPGGPWPGGMVFDRYLVVVLENTNYSDAMADPYLASLTAKGSLFTDFHGNFHPSYGNYLAMVGGKYFGTILDAQKNIDDPNVADLLEAHGLTWKNYAEGYPGNCYLASTAPDNYARKHVPFLSFTDIQNDPARCARVVPGPDFQQDVALGQEPTYMFYSPNLQDDGHDSDLPTASKWLQGFLDPLLANAAFMDRTLIEITFDESKTYLNNHIYTLFVGPMVKQGYVEGEHMDHYRVLRTVEDNFAIGTLDAEDSEANPVLNVWTDPTDAEAIKSVHDLNLKN